ncbi:hypothetical protein HJG60_011620 [Phyllostomus discolor]|uniref:Uncharacterized protein n=1 Tax=Phyllostomus discolor TaxID=89673 RepID=A0A834E0Y0_9CHIR|nr:hypothetical protein HJG60_011620 [Phyllostomus discolor]
MHHGDPGALPPDAPSLQEPHRDSPQHVPRGVAWEQGTPLWKAAGEQKVRPRKGRGPDKSPRNRCLQTQSVQSERSGCLCETCFPSGRKLGEPSRRTCCGLSGPPCAGRLHGQKASSQAFPKPAAADATRRVTHIHRPRLPVTLTPAKRPRSRGRCPVWEQPPPPPADWARRQALCQGCAHDVSFRASPPRRSRCSDLRLLKQGTGPQRGRSDHSLKVTGPRLKPGLSLQNHTHQLCTELQCRTARRP